MDPITEAFDPEAFRRDGHKMVDALADYLAKAESRDIPVVPAAPPEELVSRWPAGFPEDPAGGIDDLTARIAAASCHMHHPRCTGHQVAAPLPRAALIDMAVSLLNNSAAVYELSPLNTAMERAAVRWMAGLLGFGEGADGVLTSGGSAGNLTALLAARQAKAGFDIWKEGNGPKLAVLVSAQAHYSVKRAAQIMGWGKGGAVEVACGPECRMSTAALEEAYAAADREGYKIVAVAANACSTATGTYDRLGAVADFCEKRGLWLHVDGAHGASAALVEEYRHLLKGVERADSVVWDAHKMMMLPSLITAVIFKDGRRSYEAFSQQASYLFQGEARDEWYNFAQRTLECTKRALGVTLYGSLALHGTRVFAEHVRRSYGLARSFARMIRAEKGFELAVEPESNIVCFRYVGSGRGDLDRLQAAVRRRILSGEKFYLVQTQLPTGVFLRCALMNPLTTEEDLAALLREVRAAAQAEQAG